MCAACRKGLEVAGLGSNNDPRLAAELEDLARICRDLGILAATTEFVCASTTCGGTMNFKIG